MTVRTQPLLFSPIDVGQREPLMADYHRFLHARNGPRTAPGQFQRREESLQQMNASTIRSNEPIDQATFDRLYAGCAQTDDWTPTRLLLVAFTRINAAEAYGVQVVQHVRKFQEDSSDHLQAVQHILHEEENYHTRILVGATQYFGVEAPGAFEPPRTLKVLIHSLAYSPRMLFHPILLASEIGGIYMFHWLLKKIPTIIKQPDLRDALEERLCEVLIDEVGHVAFNRLAVGPVGLHAGRKMAPKIAASMPSITPELKLLGFQDEVQRLADFDIKQLPKNVLRRAFYV